MTLETKHFFASYQSHDADNIEIFIDTLETAFSRICAELKIDESELSGRYIFHLCSEVEAYIRATGKSREEYQSWMVGNSDFSKKQITMLSPNALAEFDIEYLQKSQSMNWCT